MHRSRMASQSRRRVRQSATELESSTFARCRVATAKDDVPPVGECPFRLGGFWIESRNEQVATPGITDRVEDRVERPERVAREVHLRHEPARELGAEQREVNVRRTPSVGMVAPRIGAGLDRY